MTKRVLVLGAGAAGMLAAGMAARGGSLVTLLERNDRVGKKLRITGKGRCNVTNNCDTAAFIAAVPQNGRFLYSAAAAFSPQDTMAFFESLHVPLKTERGNRVFPQSEKASDIVKALEGFCLDNGVELINARAKKLLIKEGRIAGVLAGDGREFLADSVVVACGGKSYPMTGSTGDGYTLASEAGHTITPIRPSLVPLISAESWCRELQGLSLRNVAVKLLDTQKKKTVYEDFGELLFTHFGLSGPVILSASAHMRDMSPGRYQIAIDLKPALSPEQLDRRVQRDFQKNQNRNFENALSELLPRKLIPVAVRLSGIAGTCKCNQLTKEMRRDFVSLLKSLKVTIEGFRPIDEAIVTCGGVSVKEINPKTMESKKVKGLYFAGEVIDVDAYTGGFNLQIAFSTGYLAGNHASKGEE